MPLSLGSDEEYGVLSLGTFNVKAKYSENFPSPKNLQNFDPLGALEIRRYEK